MVNGYLTISASPLGFNAYDGMIGQMILGAVNKSTSSNATRVALLSLVRESYRESNGSAGTRNIAAMVTTKGVKLSR